MIDAQTLHEACEKLRQLGFRALANRLELNSRNTLSKAESVLREHYFHRLADRLATLTERENPNEHGIQ